MGSIEHLKAGLDLRHLVETELGRPHSQGNAWTWRCPFHNEQHGYNLAVWQNGWRCFGACGAGGDAIAWVMQRENCTFTEAVQKLGGAIYGFQVSSFQKPVDRSNRFLKPASEPPPTEWQTAALKVVEQAETTLWSAAGERALVYLRQGRGLYKATIREARLGYVPGHYRAWLKLHGLNVPCGITIPWFVEGALWGIKVRRAGGDVRYEQIGGGHITGGLYWADNLAGSNGLDLPGLARQR
jgi:DNA primase